MTTKLKLEEVYTTEGVPTYTFVRPPNYNDILLDLRNQGKPVILEGQSGTGKTTTVKTILETEAHVSDYQYLSARKETDLEQILKIASRPTVGAYIIDDFHRLGLETQEAFANLIKIAAEEQNFTKNPKVIIIGINKIGSNLIHLVPDIAKRTGIHKILLADSNTIDTLIKKGEDKLNVKIANKSAIYEESKGDYWLTQHICQTICLTNDILEAQDQLKEIAFELKPLRKKVIAKLENAYSQPVVDFCRGKRFRPTNDPYLKLLKTISDQDSSIVDLTQLANTNPDVRGSINNIKEKRLSILLDSKPTFQQHFYYNQQTKQFALEDPALFYYIKHLDWEKIRKDCGFRDNTQDFEFDFALSFAGENRDLARRISTQLELHDASVFLDELFEANYLGRTWSHEFNSVFGERSRFIVCLLDHHHEKSIWPTFEREIFTPRLAEGAVIPIFLDETKFIGIPQDTVGIHFHPTGDNSKLDNEITDSITVKLLERLESE